MQTRRHSILLLAGGAGMRLRPITLSVPKPLLSLGDTTPIAMLLSKCEATEPEEIVVATGYGGALVEAYVKSLGLRREVRFMREEQPLGTAGPIASLGYRTEPLLVCNCDVVSDIDLDEVLARHAAERADFTVVAVEERRELPYGRLLTGGGGELIGWDERECVRRLVSAGIYVVAPAAAESVRAGERLDMHTLAARVLERKLRAVVHVHRGAWVDLGGADDYEKAQKLYETLAPSRPANQPLEGSAEPS